MGYDENQAKKPFFTVAVLSVFHGAVPALANVAYAKKSA